MRLDGGPPHYIGQREGDSNFSGWFVFYVGGDQGWVASSQFFMGTEWPWFYEENYDPWP